MTNPESVPQNESAIATRLALANYNVVPVHGMGQGAWCWKLFNPYIETAGPRITEIDLPVDNPKATIEDYEREVSTAIEGLGKIVLLGSSMAGRWITEVARKNRKVEAVINICASAPYFDDTDVEDVRRREPPRHTARFMSALETDKQKGVVKFNDEKVVDLLFPNSTPDIQEWARANQRPQGILARRIPVLPRPSGVKIVNLRASEDRALRTDWTEFAEAEIWQPDHADVMRSDHMPMLSRPAELGHKVIEYIKTLVPSSEKVIPGGSGNAGHGREARGVKDTRERIWLPYDQIPQY
jgi:pimeloyl-ACP methyl ester carboxylesterase